MAIILYVAMAFSALHVSSAQSAGDRVALFPCGAIPSRQGFSFDGSPGPLANHIVSRSDPSLVFDIDGPSNATGTDIHVWGSYTPPVLNQQWQFDSSSGRIVSMYNKMCVAVAQGVFASSALVLAECTSGTDNLQEFSYSSTSFTFSSKSDPSLCLQAGDTKVNCSIAPFSSYLYCDPTQGLDARINDLVSRMTPQEKAAALDASSPAIPRLAVPALPSGEGLHGVACGCLPANATSGSTGCPTSFPCPMALAAAFSPAVWHSVGNIIGHEARALYNAGAGSMWLFAPNVNPARDPRWGRSQEVPGEDPLVVARYAENFIRGMQEGEDHRYLLAAATAKHLAVYDLEGFEPRTDPQPHPASGRCDTPGGCQRWNFDGSPPLQDYVNYYLAPFYAAVVKAKVRSIMCSYNAQYGVPSCGFEDLQEGVVRGEWLWDGHVVSDYTAIELIQDTNWNDCPAPYPPIHCTPHDFPSHNYTHTVAETANVALTAGTDVNLGPFYNMWLGYLVSNGSVAESLVDRSVKRFYRTHFLLGLFDDPATQPYPALPPSTVDSRFGRAIAYTAAQQSIVLLKNQGNVLPLTSQFLHSKKIAFIGPHANSTDAFLSNYHGQNDIVLSHSPLLVAASRHWSVSYARGCNICDIVPPGFPNMPCPPGKATDKSGIAAAVSLAQQSDLAVVFVGLDQTSEAENFDRSELGLPGVQEELVRAVLAVQPHTIVVLISGGPVCSEWLVANAPVLLQAFYGGQYGADAILDALEGIFSPAGRLPVTMYYPNVTARDIRETDLSASGGITHLYFNGSVLLPFGWGLSYTTFSFNFSSLDQVSRTLKISTLAEETEAASGTPYAVQVTNTGNVTSDCVVLAFLSPAAPSVASDPLQSLFDFARLPALAPGETRTYLFTLPHSALTALDSAGRAWMHPREYTLAFGDTVRPARATLSLVGPATPLPQGGDSMWQQRVARAVSNRVKA